MNVREVAEIISKTLRAELGDDLLAVGWYSKEMEQRTNTIYLSESFNEHEEAHGQGVLESSLLESIGNGSYEETHGETLTTTIRVYETIVDFNVHLGESEGVVAAADSRSDYSVEDILGTIRDAIPDTLEREIGR